MTIKEIFESMDYGPAPESAGDALAWIVDQGSRFGHFIDGAFTEPGEGFDSRNPATGEVLATLTQATPEDVDTAVAAARAAQPAWEALGGPGRARYLYALARLLQKHARLFAVLETLDNGKPIRESRDIDIPLAQRHFYYHAGMAQLMDSELPDRQALGVCGQIVPWNFPLLMLSWKIAPAVTRSHRMPRRWSWIAEAFRKRGSCGSKAQRRPRGIEQSKYVARRTSISSPDHFRPISKVSGAVVRYSIPPTCSHQVPISV